MLFSAAAAAAAILPAFGKPVFGVVSTESSPASDAFAAAHLALIFTVFFWFSVFAWFLHRRARAPNKEREFIEDLHEDQLRRDQDKKRLGAGAEAEESREPWEQPGDWWKDK